MLDQKLSNGNTIRESCVRLERADSGLQLLRQRFGDPELRVSDKYYQALIRSIIFQQLSGKAANTIYSRFLALYKGGILPNPEILAQSSVTSLRKAGLSRQKAIYVIGIAEKFVSSNFLNGNLHAMTDAEVSQKLTNIKGVGQWTADMFMIFTLGRPDILPVKDVGIQKGMQVYFKLSNRPNPVEMETLAKIWRPYRSLACWYMWRIVDEKWDWSPEMPANR
jgi:DNA-3-methyladenine glycosylase II